MSPAWYSPCHRTPPYPAPPLSFINSEMQQTNKYSRGRREEEKDEEGGWNKNTPPQGLLRTEYKTFDHWHEKQMLFILILIFPPFISSSLYVFWVASFFVCFFALHCISFLRENLWDCTKGIGKMYWMGYTYWSIIKLSILISNNLITILITNTHGCWGHIELVNCVKTGLNSLWACLWVILC